MENQKSAEDILADYFLGIEVNGRRQLVWEYSSIRDQKDNILKAMEEYANQFKPQSKLLTNPAKVGGN